jgi:hypothetical protein
MRFSLQLESGNSEIERARFLRASMAIAKETMTVEQE